ncbi:MAG: DUF1828 domain-containing protein [Anaerolineaceae bacterium]|nr:DUF1828 domain-containing protein [Anaerolineaceae bacterium]
MSIHNIQREFMDKVSKKVWLTEEGVGRYRVFTPFQFDDGDHLSIVLKQVGKQWQLTDEAHTFMHLTYEIDEQDLLRGNRQTIIDKALSMFYVEDRDGELVLNIENGQYGDALYSFVQALLRITDVSYLSRERVRSTFMENFKALLTESVPEERRTFDWYDPQHDSKGLYKVDCHINGMPRPLIVHALNNDEKTQTATIALLEFERWGLKFQPLAVFEEQENIGRSVLARYSNVGGKQFSNLGGDNRNRIERFIEEFMANGVA